MEPPVPKQGAREFVEREVVLVLLGPADQDGAAAVEPGDRPLDDPPPGLPGPAPTPVLLLLADAPHVRCEPLPAQAARNVCNRAQVVLGYRVFCLSTGVVDKSVDGAGTRARKARGGARPDGLATFSSL